MTPVIFKCKTYLKYSCCKVFLNYICIYYYITLGRLKMSGINYKVIAHD